MRIDRADVMAAYDQLSEVNRTPLENLEIIEDGEKVLITDECREEWSFIGLSNSEFIRERFWENYKDSAEVGGG